MTDYIRGLSFITKAGVGIWTLIPGLLGGVVGGVLFYLFWSQSDDIGSWMFSWYKWERGQDLIRGVGTWISFLFLVVFYLLIFKYVVLIIGAPFMTPVSEKIESFYISGSGKHLPYRSQSFVGDIVRAARLNIRNLFKEIGLTIVLFLLSLIPGLAVFTGPLLFLLGAYYAGFGNMDFTLERHYDYRESIRFVRRHRGTALGNGIIFMFLFSIPFVGVFIALPLGTAAATLSSLDAISNE